jgi:long-chain fatty acid transport protein
MRRLLSIFAVLSVMLLLTPVAQATNGDALIGIGPISRAMGGAGTAAPQDAVSAIFANPAAMCFGPYCPGSTADFAGTYFNPTAKGKMYVPTAGPTFSGEATSELNPFVVPAIGISSPINPRWRFGIGMYGVSGLGVDYKTTAIDFSPAFPPVYTQLQVMKFAPNLAWLATDNFSLGASLEIVWQNLDLGQGAAHGYTLGAQIGALWHIDRWNIGLSFTTPESITHKNVSTFNDPTGAYHDLKLENPTTVKLRASFEPTNSWLFEVYTRWYGWSSADGYKDFDWEDQWVVGVGGQWKPAEKWALRAGYNYGKSPVKVHNGWDPTGSVNVQGTSVNRVGYETLRVIGFPAIVEHHFTLGAGYKLTQNVALNLSFMYAPEQTLTETSAGPPGGAVVLEAKLKEWSSTFGISWYF